MYSAILGVTSNDRAASVPPSSTSLISAPPSAATPRASATSLTRWAAKLTRVRRFWADRMTSISTDYVSRTSTSPSGPVHTTST